MTIKIGNSIALMALVMLFVSMIGPVLYPASAQAYDFYKPDIGQEADGSWSDVCPGPGLTRRIVPCIKESLLYATNEILYPFSDYMANTVLLMCALAVALLGAMMLAGKTTAPWRDSMTLLVKIAMIGTFSVGFGGLLGSVLDVMDYLLVTVTYYVMMPGPFQLSMLDGCPDWGDWYIEPQLLIWDAVDCAINKLVGGIFSPLSLTMGLVGFLLACLGSNTLGVIIGLMGLRLITQLIWAVFRALYVFIGAYIAVCLMVLMSPIFIPMVLFTVTKSYFDRWLKGLIAFILQPVFLFAYLAMLLAAFDVIVYSGPFSLYHAIAGDAVEEEGFCIPFDEGGDGCIGGWLWSNGGYMKDNILGSGIPIDQKGFVRTRDAITNAGYQENTPAMGVGTAGNLAGTILKPMLPKQALGNEENRQQQYLRTLGLGASTSQLNIFKVDTPIHSVDWWWLADLNGFSDPNPEANADLMVNYMLKILMSFFMALITAYVFLSLIDSLPFISRGITNAAGFGSDKVFGHGGVSGLQPPGSEGMRGLQDTLSGRFKDAGGQPVTGGERK